MIKVKDIINTITKDLPGSIGAAQVGQVVKRTLDYLAKEDTLDVDHLLIRRYNAIQKEKKKAEKKGSANCILPRAAKK